MNWLTRFSLLEFLMLVPVCVCFLVANLTTRTTSDEWYPFNSGYFIQTLERGWPKVYQHETSIRDYHGNLVDTDRAKWKMEFLKATNPRITSPVAFTINACALLLLLVACHCLVFACAWLRKRKASSTCPTD